MGAATIFTTSVKQLLDQLFLRYRVCNGDFNKYRAQRANSHGVVIRNGQVMRERICARQPDRASGLPRDDIPQSLRATYQLGPGEAAWQFHAAITSSRTK